MNLEVKLTRTDPEGTPRTLLCQGCGHAHEPGRAALLVALPVLPVELCPSCASTLMARLERALRALQTPAT